MDRRSFLRTIAVGGVAAAGLTAWPTPRTAQAARTGPADLDLSLPDGWTFPVAADLLPFGHGVASGDPLADRVVLWTRVTIPDPRPDAWDATVVSDPQGITQTDVAWIIATDPQLREVVGSGTVATDASRDWTVKVDVDGLPSATTLYYAFTALGYRSPVGRTRTAPAPGDPVEELTVAHLSCSSWWQDQFNAYARIAERDDLDLVTHAGDYIYETSGGHPASRYWADQRSWDGDIDNRAWVTRGECRRRYALYYQDRNLLAAHLAAPFAIMPDNHDVAAGRRDGEIVLTSAEAGEVFYEWTPTRAPLPDGSGAFGPAPGPDVNVPVPRGQDALLVYRALPYGDLAEFVLLDQRQFRNREGEVSQLLGDTQWAWLCDRLLDSAGRGVAFRYLVNQINMSQLRVFNLPFATQLEQAFGLDANAPSGELYTTGWGGYPEERARLYRFLREHGVVDNVVLSGDSHGWFGSDLVEDPALPNYEPLTGGGLLGAVGVEMVSTSQGRPGAHDVIAEEMYFAAIGGSRGAAYNDAATFDAVSRTAALPAVVALESAAQLVNPNLRYFNWKAQYGHTMVHVRPDRVLLEAWHSPQRTPADDATLLAQFESRRGAPHLRPRLPARPVVGSRRDPAVPAATTVATPTAPPAAPSDGLGADRGPRTPPASPDDPQRRTPPPAGRPTPAVMPLPVTGGGATVGGLAALGLAAALRRRRQPPASDSPAAGKGDGTAAARSTT